MGMYTMLQGVAVIAFLLVYFAPAMAAISRHHLNAMAIFLTNLLLGWTVIGWVVALIWAFTRAKAPEAEMAGQHHRHGVPKWVVALLMVAEALGIIFLTGRHPEMPPPSVEKTSQNPELRKGVPVPADELFGK